MRGRRYRIAVLLCGTLTAATAAAEADPGVDLDGRRYVGRWADQDARVAEFLGLPFAKPPVGERRWRAPQAPGRAAGEAVATRFAPACMQGPHIVDWYADVARAFGFGPEDTARPVAVSEDCLYLNVWTPAARGKEAGEGLPVLVWVHGGSNRGGWSYEPNYRGARLAELGAVVVTVAYRLGPFGFFAHPALDADPEASKANYGVLDIGAALRWVRRHAAAFGGDPDNITALGESAGAANLVAWLGMSAGSDPVARRFVLQSLGGPIRELRSLQDEQRFGLEVAGALGIPRHAQTAKRLRAVAANELLAAADNAAPEHEYAPVIDGLTLEEDPLDALDDVRPGSVDLLIGTNRDEWLMYLPADVTWADVDTWLAEHAPGHSQAIRAAVEDAADPRAALDRLETSLRMRCPGRGLARGIHRAGGRVWVYYFTRQRPGERASAMGAYHGTEIAYVFDAHEPWQPVDETDRALTGTVMGYWLQFARTGNPNFGEAPSWPEWGGGRNAVMNLGGPSHAAPPRDAELCGRLGW